MKKIIFVLLALLTVLSVMSVCITNASAATNGHTQAEAIQWLNSKIGTQIGDGQCPALAKEYYAYLGYSVSGNGKDYENNVPSGWQRIYYYSGFVPQPGDVAVWRATNTTLGAKYGHVAIVQSGTSSSMTCYEQGNSAGYKVRTNNYYYGMVTCFIRPDFSNAQPPQTPTVFTDKEYYVPGNTVNFSFNTSANSLHLYIYKDGEKWFEGEYLPDAKPTFTVYQTGHYAYYIVAHFNEQDIESVWADFDVVSDLSAYIAEPPIVSVSSSKIYINTSVTIYHWSEKASYYWVYTYLNDELLGTETHYTGSYDTSFTTPGDYTVTVYAVNSYGVSNGSSITFSVLDTYLDTPEINLQKKYYHPNEKISVSFDSSLSANNSFLTIRNANTNEVIIGPGLQLDISTTTFDFSISKVGTYLIEYQLSNSYNTSECAVTTIYIIDELSIEFDVNDGECSILNKTIHFGSTYGELPVPTRKGYIFKGWFTSESGGTQITADTQVTITEDQTLYAHWEHDTFIVSENAAVTVSDTNKLIYGENLLCMSEYDLLDLFENDNASVIMESSRISTGTTINLIDDSDEIYDTLTVVIFGDVDGDGFYDGSDAYKVNLIVNGWLTREQVGEAVWAAADCNHDGVIDALDVALLERAGLLLSQIDQSKSESELLESDEFIEYQSIIDQSPDLQDSEPEITPDPEPETEPDIFEQIISILKQVIEFILSFVKRLYK